MPVRVILVDDHPVFLAGLHALLDASEYIQIVGEANNGTKAIEVVRQTKPDVVIMDISMPDLNGIEATKQILAVRKDTKVLALSIHSGKRYVKDMLDAGAKGYLLKDSAPDELISAVQKIMNGEMYLSSAITKIALEKDNYDEELLKTKILTTKLHRPPVTDDYIIRESIIAQLDRNIDKPFSLISASAGYGKSVTVSQWMEQTHVLHTWISLDEEHCDPRIFLLYIHAAIERIFPGSLGKIAALTHAAELPPLSVLSTILINELDLIEQDFILVLDDYHRIHEEIIHQLIDEILRFPPQHLHLVIITRRDPSLRLNALRSHNRMTEIRMQELAFTESEIISLFQRLQDFTLKDETAKSLLEKTEGWVVGLRLASLTIKDSGETENILLRLKGDLNLVSEFLVEEVLMIQTTEIQEILMMTAIFNRFSANLIDTLLASGENKVHQGMTGEEFIRQSIKANLFVVPLDSENQWFRYHHLFQELLLKQLKKLSSKEKLAQIHIEAARWHEKKGLIDEAIDHFLSAGDADAAAELIRKYAHAEFLQGVPNVDKWLNKLPDGLREKQPALLLIEAWHAFGQFHLEKIPAILEKVEVLLDGQMPPPALSVEIIFFKGNLLYWMGETQESIKTLKQALDMVEDLPIHVLSNTELVLHLAYHRSGQKDSLVHDLEDQIRTMGKVGGYRLAYTYGCLTFVHLLSGNLPQAKEVAHQMQLNSASINANYLLTWSRYLQASAHLQLFTLDEALSHFTDVYENRYILDSRAALDALASQALVHQFNHEPSLATHTISVLMSFAQELNDPQSLLVASSAQARINLLQGDMDSAYQWAGSFNEPPNFAGLFFWLEVPWVTQAKVLIANGTPETLEWAERLLIDLLELTTSSHLVCQTIEINILLAVACKKQDRTDEALIFMGKTVFLAETLGWIRPFIEAGPEMEELLRDLHNKEIASDYIEILLTAFLSYQQINGVSNTGKEHKKAILNLQSDDSFALTSREKEIILLLSQGLRNKEIADKLYVSTDTIKKHLYNTFQKLHVSSRIELINKVQDLGLQT